MAKRQQAAAVRRWTSVYRSTVATRTRMLRTSSVRSTSRDCDARGTECDASSDRASSSARSTRYGHQVFRIRWPVLRPGCEEVVDPRGADNWVPGATCQASICATCPCRRLNWRWPMPNSRGGLCERPHSNPLQPCDILKSSHSTPGLSHAAIRPAGFVITSPLTPMRSGSFRRRDASLGRRSYRSNPGCIYPDGSFARG